jgi:peptidoglycan biosynthesis protein MviN/MurJ (putative lipid II flippase)
MRYSKSGYWGRQIAALGIMASGLAVIILVPPHGPSVVKAIALSVLTAGCLGLTLTCYRNGDEIILHQHKTAWFWGSMMAMAAIIPLVIAVTWHLYGINGLLPFINPTPEDYFVNGVLSVLFLQTIGYALVRIAGKFRSGTP